MEAGCQMIGLLRTSRKQDVKVHICQSGCEVLELTNLADDFLLLRMQL